MSTCRYCSVSRYLLTVDKDGWHGAVAKLGLDGVVQVIAASLCAVVLDCKKRVCEGVCQGVFSVQCELEGRNV